MNNLAVFASGSGTNAENLVKYFSKEGSVMDPVVIISNRRGAYVHERARMLGVPSVTFSGEEFESDVVLQTLQRYGVEWIVLAGFLLKVPEVLLRAFPRRVINIHPALLPKFGGKGMYGRHVHEAVVAAGESESGITVHYVDEHYDEGEIIFQASCPVLPSDTPDDVAGKVHELEYKFVPKVIEDLVRRQMQASGVR
jgi:phosphoribosylglycinamide formyltransferase-1